MCNISMLCGYPTDTSSVVQIACYGTHTTAATEALLTSVMASGRGARFASGQNVAGGGCTEPRYDIVLG
jgi:hypothetical protein